MRRLDKRRKPRKAHVRHILVASKPDAREILEEIQIELPSPIPLQ